jgi:ABC-type uncharacterized transport system substrate-binding protein
MTRLPSALVLLAVTVWGIQSSAPAQAHPHVWVTVETTALVGADTTVTGLRHRWTFDELYSSFAVQGLDKSGGNAPSRDELAELAKINVESLKEFGYFTHSRILATGGAAEKVAVKTPIDYFLEFKDGQLALTFTLPFEKPTPAKTAPLAFTVYDPTYFIAFQFAKEKALLLAQGAPAGCTIEMKAQAGEQAQADKLSDAFSQALGPGSGGSLMADNAVVSCAEKK